MQSLELIPLYRLLIRWTIIQNIYRKRSSFGEEGDEFSLGQAVESKVPVEFPGRNESRWNFRTGPYLGDQDPLRLAAAHLSDIWVTANISFFKWVAENSHHMAEIPVLNIEGSMTRINAVHPQAGDSQTCHFHKLWLWMLSSRKWELCPRLPVGKASLLGTHACEHRQEE